jgi:hypothetical protein
MNTEINSLFKSKISSPLSNSDMRTVVVRDFCMGLAWLRTPEKWRGGELLADFVPSPKSPSLKIQRIRLLGGGI